MDNVRLKWASFPCRYQTDTRNYVLLGRWLCSLRAYLFWSTLLFSDFAIIFSWADITLFLTGFVQGESLQKSLTKSSGLYFDETSYTPCSRVNVYILVWVCQPQSWDLGSHSPSATTSMFPLASGTNQRRLMRLKTPIVLCFPGNLGVQHLCSCAPLSSY